MAQALVRAGANVKAANRYGVTPMYSAAVNGNAAMIELLLEAGADAERRRCRKARRALMTAARTGKVDGGAGAAGARRHGQREGKLEAADGADVGRARRQCRRGEAPASRPARTSTTARSSAGRRCCLRHARDRLTPIEALVAGRRATSTRRLPDGTSALVTAVQGLNYEAGVVAAEARHRSQRHRPGLDGAASDRVVAAAAARPEQSGPEAAGQRQQPRPGAGSSSSTAPTSTPARRKSRTPTWKAATA